MQLIKQILKQSWTDAGKASMINQFRWLISLTILIFTFFQSAREIMIFLIMAAVISFLLVYIFPAIFRPFLFIWLFAGRILGEIMSFIILGIFYFTAGSLFALFRRKRDNHGWQPKENRNNYEQM